MTDDGPIAVVAVDVPLPHLDRFFDYAVPPAMSDDAVVGARVRVRFAGRACNGFIVKRQHTTDVPGKLAALSKVVSSEVVLKPSQVQLIRAVADHYAGTFADVVRLAVAPRHAATEVAARPLWAEPMTAALPPGGLTTTTAGRSWLQAVEDGRAWRAFWAVPPHFEAAGGWRRGVVQAVVACLRSGRGAIVVAPEAGTMTLAHEALQDVLGRGCVARLHAQLGPAARYREYLAVARGQAKVVVGTRSAVFAPMENIGLIVVLDDGNDLHCDPHAPYPNARTVAAMRATHEKSALLLASPARSCETQLWVERGWLGVIEQPADKRRAAAPAMRSVHPSNKDPDVGAARLPIEASQIIRAGLANGPVLVQVPRGGYLVALTCLRCRTPVRCPSCHGPVGADKLGPGGRRLACRWCGRIIAAWRCETCGGATLRAPAVGAQRTAEELGRAFPGFRVIDSSTDHVVERVGANPALVVATPGAEPIPDAGYAAAVLLDADSQLLRPDPRAAEEAVRRWFAAVALVRQGSDGGTVCVVGNPSASAVQALLRLDPGGFAARELAERRLAGFPPAATFVEISGEPTALAGFAATLPDDLPGDRFGPVNAPAVNDEARQRLLLRCELPQTTSLVKALKAGLAQRSATKSPWLVRVQVDPLLVS